MGRWRRTTLRAGIYDEVLDAQARTALDALGDGFALELQQLREHEDIRAPVATLLAEAVDLALSEMKDKPQAALGLATELLAVLHRHAPRTFSRPQELKLLPERLTAIVAKPATSMPAPLGSLHTSSLIVNAEGQSLLDHLRSEFESADRIDLLCAFIKLSGFEKFRHALETHCSSRGRSLRLLTTTYMQASDWKAVERFAALPNCEVKISFDEAATRLHAKSWIFHRESGYSTAYVGSSNLSHAAQTDGLEWNVRLTSSDQPALVAQMAETFDQYWANPDQFERHDRNNPAHQRRLLRALSPIERRAGMRVDIEPKDFQKPILAELMEARRLGRHRNLLVAATGTGKTVMAALDYKALREARAVDTLLYVAHRKEILEQAREVFRSALQTNAFGELLFQGQRPEHGRHVFASIDSIDPTQIAGFDMIIVDEAHHAAAKSWEALLLQTGSTKELLGLTGTPERADGLHYEHHFPRPWAGNLRLWNAIPTALVPFRYYMLDVDGVDLRDVGWRNGGYVDAELSTKLVTAADVFVRRAVDAIVEQVARPVDMRAIAFCASVRHAEEVARAFNAKNEFNARVLTGETPKDERRRALDDLDSGRFQILCVVDLYNEGVDLPNVNTLFFFRPTESATVFLQQLGRGLRRAPLKSELVVIDVTGRQRHEFRFDRRLRALTGMTPRELREFVDEGFGRLPSGCHFHFERRAREDVLEQLKRSIPSDTKGIRQVLCEPAHAALTLEQFLGETEIDVADIYAEGRCWTLLRRSAGLDQRALADGEQAALENVHKLLHVGDDLRLTLWLQLSLLQRPMTERGIRAMRMLFVVLYGAKTASDDARAWACWTAHASLRTEIASLAPVLRANNGLLSEPHRIEEDVPLVLHGRYLGTELSAAFDHRTKQGGLRDSYYTGVEKVANGRYDLLLTTLDKSDATKEHLKYRDFPMNETRFQWQSRADTTQDDLRGRRHLRPVSEGCTQLLFVREREKDRQNITMAFRYLGPVDADAYRGERPITIEWKLRHSMPHDLLQQGRIAD